MTLKSRLISPERRLAFLRSLSSWSVRLAMEPLSSVMTVPGMSWRVARMQSSDLPVLCE